MTPAEKLFDRLQKHNALSDLICGEGYCRRRYAGRHMRAAGAWRWSIEHEGIQPIGSVYTMTDCLKAKSLEVDLDGLFGIEIYPSE